jgi:hypothetical protein
MPNGNGADYYALDYSMLLGSIPTALITNSSSLFDLRDRQMEGVEPLPFNWGSLRHELGAFRGSRDLQNRRTRTGNSGW